MRRRRVEGTPRTKIPASNPLPLVTSQPKPCGRSEAALPDPDCTLGAVVEMVMVAVPPEVPTVTEVGEMAHVMCALVEAGWQVRATVPVNPLTDSREICEVPCWPGAEMVAEEPNTEKSAVGVRPAQEFVRAVTSDGAQAGNLIVASALR